MNMKPEMKVNEEGTKCWYLNGKLYREDGPAVEWTDGSEFWYLNGKLHREDGPAFVSSNGHKRWFLNGVELDTKEVEKWLDENDIDLSTDVGQMAFKLRFM